jgi:hypothetical protein
MPSIADGFVIGTIFSYLSSSIGLLIKWIGISLLRFMGLQYYVIPFPEKQQGCFKLRNFGLFETVAGQKYGLVMGKMYLGIWGSGIVEGGWNSSKRVQQLYIITTDWFYNNQLMLLSYHKGSIISDFRYINIYIDNCGGVRESFARLIYFNLQPTPMQSKCGNQILSAFKTTASHSCSCYLSGKSGTGKSSMANFMAVQLKASVTDSSIFESSRNLDNIYNLVQPTKERPLIIRNDEIDLVLNKIIEKETKQANITIVNASENAPTIASKNLTKRDWNVLMDRIAEGSYPYTIFIFTSNVDPEEFDKKDPSYLRKGRFTFRFKFEEEISAEYIC